MPGSKARDPGNDGERDKLYKGAAQQKDLQWRNVMSAKYDEMQSQLMYEVAGTDAAFLAIANQMTNREMMIYLFKAAHEREMKAYENSAKISKALEALKS